MSVLPKELNYTGKLQALPSSTHTISCVISPINGTEFENNGSVLQFDLPSRGYLVPQSMYLRYRHTVITASGETMLGTPVYTPFSRCETIIGASVVESIQDYNQVCNMIVNTKLNVAQKVGIAEAFGYLDKTTTPSFVNMNGTTLAAASTVITDKAAPLGCLLSNCENLFPLGLAPAVRIQLTTEALTTMFETTLGYGYPTSSKLSRVELCFDIVEFGPEVDSVVRSMADQNGNLIIKSQSYSTSTLTLASGTSGTQELTYNQRVSSIKSIFALFAPTSTGGKKFSSKDVSKNAGTYQFFIGSEPYPPRPLDAQNKAGMLMELTQAWSNAHSIDACNMSITRAEYNGVDGTADTGVIPSKFYVGANVERLSSNSAILTGVSSQLSPISLRVNIPTGTTDKHNATLVLCYDALIELNVMTRQANVKS